MLCAEGKLLKVLYGIIQSLSYQSDEFVDTLKQFKEFYWTVSNRKLLRRKEVVKNPFDSQKLPKKRHKSHTKI